MASILGVELSVTARFFVTISKASPKFVFRFPFFTVIQYTNCVRHCSLLSVVLLVVVVSSVSPASSTKRLVVSSRFSWRMYVRPYPITHLSDPVTLDQVIRDSVTYTEHAKR